VNFPVHEAAFHGSRAGHERQGPLPGCDAADQRQLETPGQKEPDPVHAQPRPAIAVGHHTVILVIDSWVARSPNLGQRLRAFSVSALP
jgi:hypothetical protein